LFRAARGAFVPLRQQSHGTRGTFPLDRFGRRRGEQRQPGIFRRQAFHAAGCKLHDTSALDFVKLHRTPALVDAHQRPQRA
jgi:hypothetical protein